VRIASAFCVVFLCLYLFSFYVCTNIIDKNGAVPNQGTGVRIATALSHSFAFFGAQQSHNNMQPHHIAAKSARRRFATMQSAPARIP
jgi:hypothetical protein